MIDEPFRRRLAQYAAAPLPLLPRLRVTPRTFPWSGLLPAFAAMALLAGGALVPGGLVWFLSRLADGYDAMLARYANRSSLFDSCLDLPFDMLAYAALACAFVLATPGEAAIVCAAVAVMSSYSRGILLVLVVIPFGRMWQRTLLAHRILQP